jgi:hypothetical protein
MDESGRVLQVERPRSGDTPGSQDRVGQLMAETPFRFGWEQVQPWSNVEPGGDTGSSRTHGAQVGVVNSQRPARPGWR